MSIAPWVGQALAAARRHGPLGDTGKKLDIVREAAQQVFPSGDIEQVLAEIERG